MLTEEIKQKLIKQGNIFPKQIISILNGLIVPEEYRTPIEYIYCQCYGLKSPKKCKCGELCTFLNFRKGYSESCGRRSVCEYAKNVLLSSMESTWKEKYGVSNPFKDGEVKAKIRKTNLEKYGYEIAAKNKDVKAKAEATSVKRYGTKHPLSSSVIRDKIAKTNIEKYGAENVFASEIIKQKLKDISLEKYGVDNPSKSEEVKSKIKKTMMDKYGVEYATQADQFKQKIVNTCIEKYGACNPGASEEIKAKARKNKLSNYYDILLKDCEIVGITPLFTKEEYVGSNFRSVYKWKCNKCGTEYEARYYSGDTHKMILCPKCHPVNISSAHEELINYLKDVIGENYFKVNTRTVIKPLELDIYIPEKKLAIEFNGDYWHSNYRKGSEYHLEKLKMCLEKDIKLINIWEYDWKINKSKILGRLSNALGVFKETIYARKCTIQVIDTSTAKDFINKHHLQGYVRSSVNLGLYFKDRLVAVMTFGKPRFNKKYQWELLRFCTSCHIPGAASKLLKYFENNYSPESLISYASRDWGTGNMYNKLGMVLVEEKIKPNYVYVKGSTVLSRYQCQKHKLSNILGDKFDPSLSETDNMIKAGYLKIYDCGNLTYVKSYKNV